jgi:hypothetical protein
VTKSYRLRQELLTTCGAGLLGFKLGAHLLDLRRFLFHRYRNSVYGLKVGICPPFYMQ